MAQNKNTKRPVQPQPVAEKGKRLDSFFEQRTTLFFYITLALVTVFSLAIFDLKIGVGGDDSAYITRAYDLVNGGTFPSFQGPLYPIVLSLFVAIWGISIPLLKLLSLAFMLIGFRFLYKAFRGRMSAAILHMGLFICSINSMLLFYASQTYVEAFFFMLLSIGTWLFFKCDTTFTDNQQASNSYKALLSLAAISFILGITKTIGWAFLISVLLFWAIQRKWKISAILLAIHAAFNAIWYVLKLSIWGYNKMQFSDQASTLLLKNPYVESQGKEDLGSFLMRFVGNSEIYLSKHVYAFFGLRSILDPVNLLLTALVLALIIAAFLRRPKTNYALLFAGILVSLSLGISFLVLQTIWDTPRLIMPFMPFLLLFVFGALYDINSKRIKYLAQILVPVVMAMLFMSTFSSTMIEVKKDRTGLSDYISGNTLKGYSPDWVNYIKMCDWAAQNTPDSVMIAARKPSIAFLNTGRKFHGVYRIPMQSSDTYFQQLKASGKAFALVDEAVLEALKVPAHILRPWKGSLDALFVGSVGDNNNATPRFYGIYLLETDEAKQIYTILKNNGMTFIPSIDELLATLAKENADMNIISPDELISELRDRNVRYIVMANLRKFEAQKTPYTINTVRRYIFYIQHKYPGTFTQLSEVGNDEKAYLFEIHFERLPHVPR